MFQLLPTPRLKSRLLRKGNGLHPGPIAGLTDLRPAWNAALAAAAGKLLAGRYETETPGADVVRQVCAGKPRDTCIRPIVFVAVMPTRHAMIALREPLLPAGVARETLAHSAACAFAAMEAWLRRSALFDGSSA